MTGILDTNKTGLRNGCKKECPGCAHRMLGAEESEARKVRWLEERLAPWKAKFRPVSGVRGAARWGYRDRVCLSARWSDSSWKFGLIRRDELIAIPHCPIHSKRVRSAMALLAEALPPYPAFPVAYYVQSGAQIVVVAKTNRLPDPDWASDLLWDGLQKNGVEGLWLHLHPSAGKRIFSKNSWHLIRGKSRSLDQDGLLYGPAAFHQLIPALYQEASDEAEKFLSPCEKDIVIDLYCGTGSTLKRWTDHGAEAAGVELGGEAVSCALNNAPLAHVLRGSCKMRIPQLSLWSKEKTCSDSKRLLYANPPRTGLETEVIEWITEEYQPEKMAYLSCSAGTLCKNLDSLCNAGYRVESIHPYDFFPRTCHVETLVLLKQNDRA